MPELLNHPLGIIWMGLITVVGWLWFNALLSPMVDDKPKRLSPVHPSPTGRKLSHAERRRAAENQRQTEQRRLEERNRRTVQGVEWALADGTIKVHDLRTTQPAELQRKLDLANPYAELIVELKDKIGDLAGCMDPEIYQLASDLRQALRELRQTPELVRQKAIAGRGRELLGEAQTAVRTVRELPEG